METDKPKDENKPRPFCLCTVIGGTLLLVAAFAVKAWFREGWFKDFRMASRGNFLKVPNWWFPVWLFQKNPGGCALLVGLAVVMVMVGWFMSRRIRRLERPNSCEIATGVFILAVAFALKGLVW